MFRVYGYAWITSLVCACTVNLVVSLLYCDRGALRIFASKQTNESYFNIRFETFTSRYPCQHTSPGAALQQLMEEETAHPLSEGPNPRRTSWRGGGVHRPWTLDHIYVYTSFQETLQNQRRSVVIQLGRTLIGATMLCVRGVLADSLQVKARKL